MFFHASGNDGLSITPNRAYPVFQTDGVDGALSQIRWNNADRGAFVFVGADGDGYGEGQGDENAMNGVSEWYQAARAYNELLQRKDSEVRYEFQLRPGRPLSTSPCLCLPFSCSSYPSHCSSHHNGARA